MTTLGDYTSLLEIGFGLGIALTAFQAPIDVRMQILRRLLDEEKAIVRRPKTDLALAKRNALLFYEIAANRTRRLVHERSLFPTFAVAIGAVVNLITLIFSCIYAADEAKSPYVIWVLIVSVAYYVVLLIFFEVIARKCIIPLIEGLRGLAKASRPEDVKGPTFG